MKIEYVYPSGERMSLDTNIDNYLLPVLAHLEISDISGEYIYIDSNAVPINNDTLSLEYNGEEKTIECGEEKYKINSLREIQSEKFKIEYHEFAQRLYSNYDIRYSIDERSLLSAIEKDDKDFGINLCTFNRKIEDIKKDMLLENIHKHVKNISAIFYRPKIHLKSDTELRPVDTVARIGHEAVKHLASHSEHWEARKANGLVPARLLARTLEDDYGIYENIVAKCLVDKLYKYTLEKRDDLKNISMQMPTEESYMSVNSEQGSYFQAMKTLLKGYSNYEIEFVGELLSEQIKQVDEIINKLSECRGTILYRELKHYKRIVGAIKPTNIFMMDKDYKYVYKLWQLICGDNEKTDDVKVEDITNEYELYCQSLLLFALKHFNFKSVQENPFVFADGGFCGGKYYFMNWVIDISETSIIELGLNGIQVEIYNKLNHKVYTEGIEIPEVEDINQTDYVKSEGQYLVFNRIPSENEISRFCDLIRARASGDRRKEKMLYGELKKAISESFIGFEHKKIKVLFVPLPFKFIDSSSSIKRCIDELKAQLKANAEQNDLNACYFLSPYRPTDYTEKEQSSQVKMLLNYGYEDKDLLFGNQMIRFGVLPITVNDVNSYRRFTKILLMHMIEVEDKLQNCPICGSKFNYDGDNGNYCNCCELTLYKTKCNKCKEKFSFTKYIAPKTHTVKGDTLNIRILMNEVKEGFKNITAVDEMSGKPVCPHCR